MSTTLNEKIFGVIYDNTVVANSATPFDVFNWKQAANDLEILVLNSQVELLKEPYELLKRAYELNHEDMGWDFDFEEWKKKYEDLNNKIKELTK